MEPALTAEDRLLLLCSHVELTAGQAEELVLTVTGEIAWEKVLVRATRHGISALLYRHLRGGSCPASVELALEAAGRAARLQVLRQRAEALRLLAALAQAGIDVIPLKGLALREGYYPDQGLRPSGDLDLVLRPEDIPRAQGILQGFGFEPNESELPAEWYELSRFHHVVPYRLPGRGVQIELHGSLFERDLGVTADMEGIWERSRCGEIGGQPVRWLSSEDMLLHLAVHVCASSRFMTGLRHLVDLEVVAQYDRDTLDWATVRERCTDWQARDYVYLSLRTTAELLRSQELGAAALMMRPEGFDEDLVAAACRRVLELAPREVRPPVSDNLGQFLRSRSWRERLGWLRQSMFPPPGRIAFLYRVPPGSWRVWPCYVARPIELLARYARLVAGVAAHRTEARAAAAARAEQLRLEEWFAKGK